MSNTLRAPAAGYFRYRLPYSVGTIAKPRYTANYFTHTVIIMSKTFAWPNAAATAKLEKAAGQRSPIRGRNRNNHVTGAGAHPSGSPEAHKTRQTQPICEKSAESSHNRSAHPTRPTATDRPARADRGDSFAAKIQTSDIRTAIGSFGQIRPQSQAKQRFIPRTSPYLCRRRQTCGKSFSKALGQSATDRIASR